MNFFKKVYYIMVINHDHRIDIISIKKKKI